MEFWKKYKIVEIENKNVNVTNCTHDEILGNTCKVLALEKGERGFMMVDIPTDENHPRHTVMTSRVLRIIENTDNRLVFETINTFYTLKAA